MGRGKLQQLGIARRAGHEDDIGGWGLRVGPISRRKAAASKPVLDDVTGDADHRQPRAVAETKALANRIAALEIPGSERVRDDDNVQ